MIICKWLCLRLIKNWWNKYLALLKVLPVTKCGRILLSHFILFAGEKIICVFIWNIDDNKCIAFGKHSKDSEFHSALLWDYKKLMWHYYCIIPSEVAVFLQSPHWDPKTLPFKEICFVASMSCSSTIYLLSDKVWVYMCTYTVNSKVFSNKWGLCLITENPIVSGQCNLELHFLELIILAYKLLRMKQGESLHGVPVSLYHTC